jgi:hypothetical protein
MSVIAARIPAERRLRFVLVMGSVCRGVSADGERMREE